MSSPSAFDAAQPRIADGADQVELLLPVRAELWVLARMSASAIASRLDFGFDAVEDLRLAIDELCNSCAAGAGPESRLRLEYRWDGDTIHVACEVAPIEPGTPVAADTLALSARILDALVDDHGIDPVDARSRRGWLTKTRVPLGG